jgi:predicted transcriptional regulator
MSNAVDGFINRLTRFSETFIDEDPLVGDISKLTLINKSNMDDEITRGAARYAYVSHLSEVAKMEESIAKQEYEKARALVCQAIRRGTYEQAKGVKITDKAIEELSEIDDLVSTLRNVYNEKKGHAAIMIKLVDALSMKADLLRTYASNTRKELETLFNSKNTTLIPKLNQTLTKEVDEPEQ